jgi:hypothetical protein
MPVSVGRSSGNDRSSGKSTAGSFMYVYQSRWWVARTTWAAIGNGNRVVAAGYP